MFAEGPLTDEIRRAVAAGVRDGADQAVSHYGTQALLWAVVVGVTCNAVWVVIQWSAKKALSRWFGVN